MSEHSIPRVSSFNSRESVLSWVFSRTSHPMANVTYVKSLQYFAWVGAGQSSVRHADRDWTCASPKIMVSMLTHAATLSSG